jgi:hypothetical protein
MDDDLAGIREYIATGKLPKEDCAVTWYGPGRGARCAACDRRILSTDVGVDCDLPGGGTIHFHERCYQNWRSVLKCPTGP